MLKRASHLRMITISTAALCATLSLAWAPGAQADEVSPAGSGSLRVVASQDLARLAFAVDTSPTGNSVVTGNSFGVAEGGPLGAGIHDLARIGSLGASDIALDAGSGAVFATGITDSHLYRVDRTSGSVRHSPAQTSILFHVAVDPRRSRVYASFDGGVVAFDSRSLQRLWTASLGEFVNPDDIAVDTVLGTVWVTTGDVTAYGIDGSTGQVTHNVTLPTGGLTVAVDGPRNALFVGSFGLVYVVKADAVVGSAPLRGDASGLDVNPVTGNLYAVSALEGVIGHGYVTEIDGATYQRLGLVRLDGGAALIAASGSRTYVGAFASWQTPPRLYVLTG